MDASVLVLSGLRGFVAIVVLTAFVGGVPRIVQLGIAALVGLWTAALIDPAGMQLATLGGPIAIGAIAAREAVVGSTLGIVAAIPLLVAQTAGTLVDRAGASRGTYAGLFTLLAAAVFVGIDGHVTVVTAILESHRDLPVAGDRVQVIGTLGSLLAGATRLAIPWLVTAAVVELAIGVGVRVAARGGAQVPSTIAVPAALVMVTATLVSTLAVAIAAIVRGAL